MGVSGDIVIYAKALRQIYETLKDAPAALRQVSAESNSFAIRLGRLESREPTLDNESRKALADMVDRRACEETVRDIKALVEKISPHEDSTEKNGPKVQLADVTKLKQRVVWVFKETQVNKLLERMRAQEQQVDFALQEINMESQVRDPMKKQVAEIHEALFKQSKPTITTSQPKLEESGGIPLWLGLYRLDNSQSAEFATHFRFRKDLSDFAYINDWDRFLTRGLDMGRKFYHQNWINAVRIMPIRDLREPSGYTPLHQAAWHGAPAPIVEKLICLGAWRLARTVRDGKMQTPLDIAKDLGWTHLYSLLTPVIHHPIPPLVLIGLQKQLDDVFATIFPGAMKNFLVPQVEILTELQDSQLLALLEPEVQSLEAPVSMHLYLDQREIVARVVRKDHSKGVYRICEDRWHEIERGMLF